jgi:hypothetical protein
MSRRIQIVIDDAECERFRSQATAEGLSLSEWFRRLGRKRLEAAARERRLDSVDDLREFWQVCDSAQSGREPDWDQHLEVMRRSRGGGPSKP